MTEPFGRAGPVNEPAPEKPGSGSEPTACLPRDGGGEGRGEGATAAQPEQPPADPVLTEKDVLEGALAARLQGAPAQDERFWMWLSDAGLPAPLVPAPASGSAAHALATPADPLDEFFFRPGEESAGLPALAPRGGDALASPEVEAREKYLTFLLGPETYAVPIARVRGVLKAPYITEVPRAPSHVRGVLTVRGEVVAVVDARRRLGLPDGAGPEGERIVIVDVGEGPCGLLVDAVEDVVRLPHGSIEPCPPGVVAGSEGDCLVGIGRARGRLFAVLDVAALLRAPPPAGEGRGHG